MQVRVTCDIKCTLNPLSYELSSTALHQHRQGNVKERLQHW